MASRCTIAGSLVLCLLSLGIAVSQQARPRKQADQQPANHRPNAQFADLLNGRMFNAKFGERSVPFSKEISMEVVVDHPVGNDVRGAWGRGVVRATKVGGKATDENHVTFYVIDNDLAMGALQQGRRYFLTGRIRNGLEASGRSAYSFELSRAPELIDDRQAGDAVLSGRVLLNGRTLNRDASPRLETKTGTYRLLDVATWPESLIGKTVQLSGDVGNDPNAIRVISLSFPKLDELVGQDVQLIGTMWSLNDHWWFRHADQKIIVSQIRKRPGWQSVGHGVSVRVAGRLEKELRPSLDQISLKTCRDLVPHFVLKQANIELVSADHRSFFFTEIHDTTPTFSDGVLDLHNEIGGIYNVMPWMNKAMLLYQRNSELIEEIIRRDSQATRDVLKKRLLNPRRRFELRLLDAGILAAVNDDEGQKFLLEHAEDRRHKHLDSVFWVVGNLHQFPPLPPAKPPPTFGQGSPLQTGPEGQVDMTSIARDLFGAPISGRPLGNVQMRWAEPLMIRALEDNSQVQYTDLFQDSVTARCDALAVEHGAFAHLLVKMNSEPAIPRLCKLVADSPSDCEDILFALLDTGGAEVVELAKTLIKQQKNDSSVRRALQGYLLRHDRELAIDDLLESIEQTYAFRALLSLGKQHVLVRLHTKLPELDGDARQHAQLLMVLLGDDPTKALLAELEKENRTSRNLVLYWLAQRTNPATATAIADLLKSAPNKFFNEGEYTNTYAVEHAIDACRVDASRESVRALISLLDADLDRFDVQRKDEDWNRYIAAHLIELTDVSFGADKTQWQRWFEKN